MLNAAARAHCTRTQAVVSATAEHGPLGGVLCGMAHGASQLGWRCGSARSDMSVDARADGTSCGARTSALDRISTLQRVDVVRARRRRHGAQQWPSRWLGEYCHEVLADGWAVLVVAGSTCIVERPRGRGSSTERPCSPRDSCISRRPKASVPRPTQLAPPAHLRSKPPHAWRHRNGLALGADRDCSPRSPRSPPALREC